MTFGSTRGLLAWTSLSAALLIAETASFAATTNSWTNSLSGLWSTASNWSSNQPPNSTFNFTLITNAASKTITLDPSAPLSSLTIQRLTVSAPVGSTNTLAMVNVTTNLPLQLSSLLTLDRGAIFSLSNSAVNSAGLTIDRGAALYLTNSVVKESGFSFFDVVNGSAWLDSGLVDCSSIQAIRLGRSSGSTATFTANGGNVVAPEFQIAAFTGSRGVLNITGATVNASSLVTVGYGVNSTGLLSVAAGQLIATNDFTYIGKSGFGQMTLSGGKAAFAFLSVGNNADGQLSVSGGELKTIPRTTNDWLQVGNLGVGQFNLSGGTAILLGEIHIGDDSSGFGTGSGVASITGGQLIATNDLTAIGRYSQGDLTISNATAWLTNVSVGRHGGAVGTLNVKDSAQLFLLDALSIARFSNSVGHVLVTGGLLSLTNDILWIGREGIGDMSISGGIVRAASAYVAVSTVVIDPVTLLPVTNLPSGSLTLAGGNLVITTNFLVGTGSVSTGQVSVAGGNLTIGTPGRPGSLAVSSGTFTLSQGSVSTDNLFLTNTTGQFIFTGGTLQANQAIVANGRPFVVGDGTSPATFQLLGGIYSFADGLVISSNATVTGCGTILGNISNFGTLATNCGPAGVTITFTTRTGPTTTVYFTTLPGSNHILEYKNSLTDATWTAVLPGVVGNGSITNSADTNSATQNRFYRIHLQ